MNAAVDLARSLRSDALRLREMVGHLRTTNLAPALSHVAAAAERLEQAARIMERVAEDG